MTKAYDLFSVRAAAPDDAEAIGRVHTLSWQTTYKGIIHQSFRHRYEQKNFKCGEPI